MEPLAMPIITVAFVVMSAKTLCLSRPSLILPLKPASRPALKDSMPKTIPILAQKNALMEHSLIISVCIASSSAQTTLKATEIPYSICVFIRAWEENFQITPLIYAFPCVRASITPKLTIMEILILEDAPNGVLREPTLIAIREDAWEPVPMALLPTI